MTHKPAASKALRGTALKRFHRDFRRRHPVQHDIAVLLQSVEYPVNVGSVFRIADAVNITELILTGITPTPPNPTLVRVARHKHRTVSWRYEQEVSESILELKGAGYKTFALEITAGATRYDQVDWPEQTCLVVGHEDHGITRTTLSLCDEAVYIPMWGKGLSLNLHVSLAVVLFHIRHVGLGGGNVRRPPGKALG